MAERPAQDFQALVPGQHSGLERAEQLKTCSCWNNADEVERAMKSELATRRRASLVREASSERFRSEPNSLLFQPVAAQPSDDDVFHLRFVERKLHASLEQAPRPQGKPAIPDVMGVIKVGPNRPNVVIVQVARIPGVASKDESVPLDAQDVLRANVMHELVKHEPRISGPRSQRIDPPPFYRGIGPRRRLIAKEKDRTKVRLLHRRLKRFDCRAQSDARHPSECHIRQRKPCGPIGQFTSFATARRYPA